MTLRQRAVLWQLMRGRSNRQIADELGIAEETVKVHLKALFVEAGVRSRLELALWAQRRRRG